MRHGLIGIAAAVAVLIASGAAAQVSYGVAKSPGVTFHAGPPAPPPGPALPPSHPPRGGGHVVVPKPGGDLFLAGPHTYSPRAARHSRLRPHLYVSPYALPLPYFLPGDYPVELASTVAAPQSHSTYLPIEPGYLVLRIQPRTAMVYVDGFFIGSAEDVRAQGYPLEPGPHRVELRAEGFETATFDVRVRANDTITYTKDLDRPALEPPPSLEPVAISQTATPKTLYVIPRCYAGDRRPSASELPAHCSLADLRVIK